MDLLRCSVVKDKPSIIRRQLRWLQGRFFCKFAGFPALYFFYRGLFKLPLFILIYFYFLTLQSLHGLFPFSVGFRVLPHQVLVFPPPISLLFNRGVNESLPGWGLCITRIGDYGARQRDTLSPVLVVSRRANKRESSTDTWHVLQSDV